MNPDIVHITFTDVSEVDASPSIYVDPAASDAVALGGVFAIANCSNANLSQTTRERYIQGPAFGPGAGLPYPSSTDRATMQFACSDGSTLMVILVAPTAACFQGDLETVDVSPGAPPKAVLDWVLLHCKNKDGNPAVAYIRGWRWKERRI